MPSLPWQQDPASPSMKEEKGEEKWAVQELEAGAPAVVPLCSGGPAVTTSLSTLHLCLVRPMNSE